MKIDKDKKFLIVGLGLLGGCYAMALKKKGFYVTAITKEQADIDYALAEKLIDLGVIGFWNFSHYDIAIKHPEVAVENVHFGDTLMRLSYKIKNS